MILLFVFLSIQSRTDSLEKVYAQNRQIETLLELNKCYVASGEFQRSMTLLGQNERYFARYRSLERAVWRRFGHHDWRRTAETSNQDQLGLVPRAHSQ